jgi:hypothetical protein
LAHCGAALALKEMALGFGEVGVGFLVAGGFVGLIFSPASEIWMASTRKEAYKADKVSVLK